MYSVINKYINKYYELPCVVDDLVPYLHFLNSSQLLPFKERMEFLIEKITEISTNRNKCLRCTLSC